MVTSLPAILATLLLLASPAAAQTPLKSFSFVSTGCAEAGLLTFNGSWQITPTVRPGAGNWPDGNFWVRAISLTYFGTGPHDWAIVGHSGVNGDWVTPPVLSGTTIMTHYAADAAPLYSVGEYFDVHSSCMGANNVSAAVSIWYVPGIDR